MGFIPATAPPIVTLIITILVVVLGIALFALMIYGASVFFSGYTGKLKKSMPAIISVVLAFICVFLLLQYDVYVNLFAKLSEVLGMPEDYIDGQLLMIFPVALVIVMLIKVKIAKPRQYHEDFLSLDSSKTLQGLAAIGVILHHLTQQVSDVGNIYKGPITTLNHYGVMFTAIFFFFSGFGLMTSLINKPNYIKTFPKRRILSILVPFMLSNIIFYLICVMLWGYPVEGLQNLTCLVGYPLLNGNTWFLVEILILYCVFYLANLIIKNRRAAFWVVTGFTLIMITVSLLRCHDSSVLGGVWFKGEWWYNTTILFVLGMAVAMNTEKIIGFAKKHYIWLLPLSIALYYTLFNGSLHVMGRFGYYKEWLGHPGYLEKLLSVLAQTSSAIAFVMMVLLLTMKIKCGNAALNFVKRLSLSLYIIHGLFKMRFSVIPVPSIVYFFTVLVASFVFAYWFDRLCTSVLGKLNGSAKALKSGDKG